MSKVLNIDKLAKDVEKSPLTKIQLAEKSGISRVTLDTVLKGKEIGLHKFLKLIDILGTNVGYYFDEEIDSQLTRETDTSSKTDKSPDEEVAENSPTELPMGTTVDLKHQIEKLTLEVNLLRNLVSEKERFINHLLETKQ